MNSALLKKLKKTFKFVKGKIITNFRFSETGKGTNFLLHVSFFKIKV